MKSANLQHARFSVRAEPVEAVCFRFGLSFRKALRRDMRPTAHSLSFACPKESKQRKWHPDSGGPGVPGLLCAARSRREVQKLALRAQTSELLFPSCPALLDACNGDPKSQRQRTACLAAPNFAAMRGEPWCIGSSGPLRRAEQRSGRREKKRSCLSPKGEFCASRLPRAAQGSPGTPGPRNRGRLWCARNLALPSERTPSSRTFGDFSLAKQRKVTALSGAHPDAVQRKEKLSNNPKKTQIANKGVSP